MLRNYTLGWTMPHRQDDDQQDDDSVGFDAVDRSSASRSFVDYLDNARLQPWVRHVKQWSLDHLELSEGDQALDLGCGTGEDVLAMASLVDRSGSAVGVDVSSTMATAARERSIALGQPA